MVGTDVGAGVGGIDQSFLISNRFFEVDPAFVTCLQGWNFPNPGVSAGLDWT